MLESLLAMHKSISPATLKFSNSAAVKAFPNLAANAIIDLSPCLAWGLNYFTGVFDLMGQHHCKLVPFLPHKSGTNSFTSLLIPN